MNSDDLLVNDEEECNGISLNLLFCVISIFSGAALTQDSHEMSELKKRIKDLEVSNCFWVPLLCG